MKHISPGVIVVFVFCIVFSGGFFGLVYPSLKPISQKLAKLNAYSEQMVKTDSNEDSDAKTAQKEALEREKSNIDKLLPDQNNIYDLSIQIEALSKASGVALTGISLTPPAEATIPQTKSQQAAVTAQGAPEGTASSNISLTVNGGYQALRSFLEGLTSLERFIEVKDISMSNGASGSSMTVNAVAYSMVESTKQAAGAQ